MVVTKYKISVSVNPKTLARIRELVRTGRFRNRSHAFEYAINRLQEVIEK